MDDKIQAFWSLSVSKLFEKLETSEKGLSNEEAQRRLSKFGHNSLKSRKRSNSLTLLLAQFKSPITLILLFAALLSLFLHSHSDAITILAIVLISSLLSFWQEKSATNAVEKLLAMVRIKAEIWRAGSLSEISIEEVVPGDLVRLSTGDGVPGDCLIIESKDLFIDEATLTGETYPVEKMVGQLSQEASLDERTNALFMGSHVVSGSAKAIVVHTGAATEFGKISERLKLKPPETEFEHGIRRFGYLLLEITLMLVIAIFAINVYLGRPVIDSFLFSLALAVGLTPQLLPAIISINLAHGAKRMADKKVIVKRLSSIENLGSMNVLCSDKTGTITEGVARIHSTLNISGEESEKPLLYAYINAFYETGFVNPIDKAIREYRTFDLSSYQKLDEIPYDFVRKRLSVLVAKDGESLMVTKGALQNVLAACSSAETPEGKIIPLAEVQTQIKQHFEALSQQGFRTLGVAFRKLSAGELIAKTHEEDMTFAGFIALYDPPKPNIINAIEQLKQLGVSLKVITGDNHLVTANLSRQIGLSNNKILTGADLRNMSDLALINQLDKVDLFAEIEPNQKERIIIALKKAGNVVGYIGDGINDASALHAADASISVDSAVDIAKDTADIVLLEKDLSILAEGVKEGRRTFANTLKYVFMATSANFGNMFSMAGVSLFLPFLPLLPKQILLTNLLTDLPEMTIATDSIDPDLIERPRRLDITYIRNFMIVFGLISSIFDYLTFGLMVLIFQAPMLQFRTGWFVESVVSASMIVLVIRTRRSFLKSSPGKYLLMATCLVIGITVVLPFTPLSTLFGFSPLPLSFMLLLAVILILYVLTAEIAKYFFYKHVKF